MDDKIEVGDSKDSLQEIAIMVDDILEAEEIKTPYAHTKEMLEDLIICGCDHDYLAPIVDSIYGEHYELDVIYGFPEEDLECPKNCVAKLREYKKIIGDYDKMLQGFIFKRNRRLFDWVLEKGNLMAYGDLERLQARLV